MLWFWNWGSWPVVSHEYNCHKMQPPLGKFTLCPFFNLKCYSLIFIVQNICGPIALRGHGVNWHTALLSAMGMLFPLIYLQTQCTLSLLAYIILLTAVYVSLSSSLDPHCSFRFFLFSYFCIAYPQNHNIISNSFLFAPLLPLCLPSVASRDDISH